MILGHIIYYHKRILNRNINSSIFQQDFIAINSTVLFLHWIKIDCYNKQQIMLLCSQHKLPLTYICGLFNCRAIFCNSCLPQHFAQTKHSEYILLNQKSVSFFLFYSQQIINQIEHIILTAQMNESSKVHRHLRKQEGMFLVQQYATKIVELFAKEKQLLIKNRVYVDQNRNHLESLIHPQFFEDIFTFVTQRWQIKANILLQTAIKEQGCSFPSKICLESLYSALIEGPSTTLQRTKQEFLRKQSSGIIYYFQQRSTSQRIQRQSKQYVELHQELLSKTESIYEILDDEKINPSINGVCIDSLQDIVQNLPSIRPNFLSNQDLQKQIQQVLIENQRLRMINSELKRQNELLKQQNGELRLRKK